MSKETKEENSLTLINTIKDNVALTTLEALNSLKSSKTKEVVELYNQLSTMPVESTDAEVLELIGDKNSDLVPTAKAIIAISKILDVVPKMALERALLLLFEEPELSAKELAKRLLEYYAQHGPSGKVFTKLAKEMVKKGWLEKNDR